MHGFRLKLRLCIAGPGPGSVTRTSAPVVAVKGGGQVQEALPEATLRGRPSPADQPGQPLPLPSDQCPVRGLRQVGARGQGDAAVPAERHGARVPQGLRPGLHHRHGLLPAVAHSGGGPPGDRPAADPHPAAPVSHRVHLGERHPDAPPGRAAQVDHLGHLGVLHPAHGHHDLHHHSDLLRGPGERGKWRKRIPFFSVYFCFSLSCIQYYIKGCISYMII